MLLIFSCLLLSFTSCKDAENSKTETSDAIEQQQKSEKKIDRYSSSEKNDPEPSTADEEPEAETNNSILAGRYKKDGHPEDANCNCYCLDIQLNATSELCLADGELYVNGRFEKDGDKINIYYAGKSARTENSDIPWDQFEKNRPIAILSPEANGMSLDWIGFTINGEIAVDYALYGKKTLEGTYNKL
ncbi:hypothetical protein MKO06_16005 [Gramella sp. GC03-9]|uniref:Uncharacterized protein n=1 Tax=Christiangramia oceanisediminis TaxID=2920386 RepID=A0A9X2RDQ5_9FLAO|nr:hypothetical protein [Gramella oceanisediminis]MCP9201415.1 hypothetical protein [Gramella oceanisediminis]